MYVQNTWPEKTDTLKVTVKQTNYVAGVQYWFYPKCRLQAQYTYCNRHKGENSNLLQAQLQVRF